MKPLKKILFSPINLTPLEDASILRKFTVLFFLMSILPLGFLFYIYIDLHDTGIISMSVSEFGMTVILVTLGIAVGYFSMRMVIKRLIEITEANRNALEVVLGPETIHELTHEKNEISILARSFSVVTNRLQENIRSLELAKRTLHSVLARVGEGIASMHNIDTFLDLIVETAVDAFSAKIGILMLTDPATHTLYVKTIFGVEIKDKEHLKVSTELEPFHAILRAHKPLVFEHLEFNKDLNHNLRNLFETPLLCAPLVLHDMVIGVLAVCGKKNDPSFQEDEKKLIHNLALQTAVAIENSKLNEDAERTYFETISALALAVDAKDRYSRGHLDRVANYVKRIAQELKLSEDNIRTLMDAARLHDVGKIGIPDEILVKPGPLTTQEMEIMRRHPEIGESIVRPIRSLRNLCDIIRHHHEKLDGTGYPDGLKGEEISLLVRITSVADIFDALTTDRPYRPRYSFGEACAMLRGMKNHLDQNLVEILLRTFRDDNIHTL